ncbi:MAG TPA: hypothetical protein VLL97_02715 [Acidobacteriota bacterium]|nr:hypothetical protein [Acidobacteriota bacterium]
MQKLKFRKYALPAVAILCLLALSGCEHKTINEILADPARYANKDVSVIGSVARSYSVLGRGAYEIEDGTGKLWVVSDKGVPRQGAKIAVKGKIRDGFNLGSVVNLPEAFSSGLVMIETSHKAR